MTTAEKLDLADAYLKGDGQLRDEAKAAQLYRDAALDNSGVGCRKYARCLRDGKGAQKDHSKAIRGLRKAAELGDRFSFYELGWLLYNTPDKRLRNVSEAENCFLESVRRDTNLKLSYFQLGRIEVEGYEKRPVRFGKGKEYLEKSAELGNAQALCYIGELFYFGEVTDKDPQKAAEYFRKGAEAGNARATADLGMCFQNGEGVEKDEKKAMELYQKAEELKYPYAMDRKFHLMLNAEDPEVRNVRAACDHMVKRVESDRDPKGKCAFELARMYRDGCELFPVDRGKAKYYFEKSHAKGNVGGTQGLINELISECSDRATAERAHSLALGINKKKWELKTWEMLIDYMDDSELMRAAAQKYRDKSYDQAFTVFERLSQTDPTAYYALGAMTYFGHGTQRDTAAAREYLEKASGADINEAKIACALLDLMEEERTAAYCPYCGAPVSSSGDGSYVCKCGGVLPDLDLAHDPEAMSRFNKATRLRQNGYFREAEQELIATGSASSSVLWCRALCRFGIRFMPGPALFCIEQLRDYDFTKLCEDLKQGLSGEPPFKAFAAEIDARCRTIREDAELNAKVSHVVIAAAPGDNAALNYARQLRDAVAQKAPAELLIDPELDCDKAEAQRVNAFKKACVFVRIASSSDRADNGAVSTCLRRFSENKLDPSFQRTLTIRLDSDAPETDDTLGNVPVAQATAKALGLLAPWYSTYRNIELRHGITVVEITEAVNKTRAVLGLPPFTTDFGADMKRISFEVARDFKRFSNEYEFLPGAVVCLDIDEQFRVTVEAREAMRPNCEHKVKWKIFDMQGNVAVEYESAVRLGRKDKHLRTIFQSWNVRYPENGNPVLKPGFYYVTGEMDGRRPLGICFAVTQSIRSMGIGSILYGNER